MASNFYGGADSGGSPTDTATAPDTTGQDAASASEPGANEGESMGVEEVVSKDFLGSTPPKVGEKFSVEITQVNDDSCLIKKVAGDNEGAGDETTGPEEEGEMGPGMMGGGEKPKSNFYG